MQDNSFEPVKLWNRSHQDAALICWTNKISDFHVQLPETDETTERKQNENN